MKKKYSGWIKFIVKMPTEVEAESGTEAISKIREEACEATKKIKNVVGLEFAIDPPLPSSKCCNTKEEGDF